MQDCLQYRSVAVQINTTAGISAGIVTFESSNGLDASNNWSALTLLDSAASGIIGAATLTLAASTNRYFVGPVNFRYFRVRVSTAVTGGNVSCSAIYRMTPFSPPVNPAVNMAQYRGVTPVTGGLAGVPSVGGNAPIGAAPTTNPVTIGGVDYSNLIRRIITDVQGHQVIAGVDPTRISNTNPVIVRDADSSGGRMAPAELLELILMELKLQSFYLKELPLMLSMPNAFYKEEISDFINSTDKI